MTSDPTPCRHCALDDTIEACRLEAEEGASASHRNALAWLRKLKDQRERLRAGIEQTLSDFGDEYPVRMAALEDLLAETAE